MSVPQAEFDFSQFGQLWHWQCIVLLDMHMEVAHRIRDTVKLCQVDPLRTKDIDDGKALFFALGACCFTKMPFTVILLVEKWVRGVPLLIRAIFCALRPTPQPWKFWPAPVAVGVTLGLCLVICPERPWLSGFFKHI